MPSPNTAPLGVIEIHLSPSLCETCELVMQAPEAQPDPARQGVYRAPWHRFDQQRDCLVTPSNSKRQQ